jgi:hypothetical protein
LASARRFSFTGLSEDPRDALVERAADLADVPWDVVVLPPGDDPAFSETMSGSRRGILSSHVDESARLIRIFNVVWIG